METGNVRARVGALERKAVRDEEAAKAKARQAVGWGDHSGSGNFPEPERADAVTGGRILVVRDDHGHEIWPLGWRQGADVQEIRIGGIDLERDL